MRLHLALRRLVQAPAFTAFSIVTLALGISVTTAIYSAILGINRGTVGLANSDEIVTIRQVAERTANFSGPEFAELQAGQTPFLGLASVAMFWTGLSGDGRAELVAGEAVSGDYFPVLGVRPALGRLLQSADDQPGAPPVVVLSHATWRQRFGGDPAVVGRTIRLAGRPFEIVGVAAEAFKGLTVGYDVQTRDLWAPLSSAPAGSTRHFTADLRSREWRGLTVVGRLAPGMTPDLAMSRLAPLLGEWDKVSPLDRSAVPRPRQALVARAFELPDQEITSTSAIVILALPALILLVACTNLANLTLSRNASRRHEFAVRRALGASRWRVVNDQLLEGAMVAGAGGAAGYLVTRYVLTFIRSAIDDLAGGMASRYFNPEVDASVLLAAGGFALLAFIIASLAPALQLTRSSDRTMLSSDGGTGVVPRWRGRANLIALQVWVSVCLFLLTAIGVRTVVDEHQALSTSADVGLAQVDLPFGIQKVDEHTARGVADRIVRELQNEAGLDGVALRTRFLGLRLTLTPPDRPLVPKVNDGSSAYLELLSPEAFPLRGISLRTGRAFGVDDAAGQAPVLIVNESLARSLFGRTDIVDEVVVGRGQDYATGASVTNAYRVVGVTTDTLDRRRSARSPAQVENVIYAPFAQHYFGMVSILARSHRLDVSETLSVIRTTVRKVDPELPISFAGRADPERSQQAAVMRLVTGTGAALALLTLMLSMTGLYGVLSHVITRRTREFGLRMALGADRRRILALVLRSGFRPVIEGFVLGVISAIILQLMVQPLFVNPLADFDPLFVPLAAGPLLVAAALACYLPARRAIRVEPNVALRNL